MTPHTDLITALGKNKCKVAFKNGPGVMFLWIDYGKLTKNHPNQGLEIWGNAQQIFEKINGLVLRYYPNAELASQSSNRTVVYRIGAK